jgi:glycosyltransferase involved in cell wall biosynthesis
VKILHLSKFYPPDPGGLEHVVAQLAQGAAARGHDVRVIAATGSSWVRSPGERTTEPPRFGVTIVRLPTSGVYWSQPIARGYVQASRWPADVVYVHRPHPLADLAALVGPQRPTIILHHSDVQRQRAAALVYRPLARQVARQASAVVVAAQSNLDHARDVGKAGRAKAHVIPFGVDEHRFVPRAHPERPDTFPEVARGPVAVFVGRLVSYKGLDVLLRAVAGTDLNVVMVGDGPLREWLAQEIVRLQLGDRVIWAGAVSDKELPGYYQSADYFVLPSTTPAEMFGISTVEAMACALPVITTALTTGVREVSEPEVTGLVVPPGNVERLRAAMQQLHGDAELRARMGEAARRRVEERFTITQMVDAHLKLCEEVVKTARA